MGLRPCSGFCYIITRYSQAPVQLRVDTTTRRALKSKVQYVRRATYSTADHGACRFGAMSGRISNSHESHAASWSSLRSATSCFFGFAPSRSLGADGGACLVPHRRHHSSNAAREPPRRLSKIWQSTAGTSVEIARALGVSGNPISACCSGRRMSYSIPAGATEARTALASIALRGFRTLA